MTTRDTFVRLPLGLHLGGLWVEEAESVEYAIEVFDPAQEGRGHLPRGEAPCG